MKLKTLIHICFLLPFVFTLFNAQVLISILVYDVYAQIMAYANLGLLVLGVILLFKNHGEFSRTAKMWIIFFILYFTIGMTAGIIHDHPSNIIVSIIPLFYVVGFYYYLSFSENRVLFEKVAFICLIIVCLLCIHWYNINFDLDKGGVHIYTVDRAQGVYGDANNMALTSIIAFVFVYKIFQPKNKMLYILKLALLFAMFYSLFVTFSNTGFMVLIVSLVMLNHNFFKGIRLLIGIILIPVLYIFLLNLNNLTADLDLVGQQRDKINNIVNIVSLNFDKVDDSGRNELVAKLLTYVYENPFFGNGVDFAISKHGHNTIIGVWADAGLFVLLFFLGMLFTYFVRAIKSSTETRFFVLPLLIAMCIFMLSLQTIINQPYLIAFFMYIGYKIDFAQENEEEDVTQIEE
ncbi:O-antigen ligase family protein [Winogradskyella algicola]|uniref:O-antigen ligase family protein n=1 Tax=Winogradskyella algicola TaxID=2575815 RepID=UPI0011092602|nr:O-antigen ligase family protein [Winogradskyella algicola]